MNKDRSFKSTMNVSAADVGDHMKEAIEIIGRGNDIGDVIGAEVGRRRSRGDI
jgi:hypothetical protein